MLNSGLHGTWHLRHAGIANSKLQAVFERYHIPNFEGRVKSILVIRIRKNKVVLKSERVEGNNPNKPKPQTHRETNEKRPQLIVFATATKEKAVVCTGVAGSAEGKAGAAVPLQAAPVPALCL